MKSKKPNKLPPITKPAAAPVKLRKGFAVMKASEVRRIASMGGTAVMSKPGHAKRLGRKGGANSHKVSNELKRAHAEV